MLRSAHARELLHEGAAKRLRERRASIREAPAAQLAVAVTPWLLAMCGILNLRAQGLPQYVAITLHAYNPWMVYSSCACARAHLAGTAGPCILQLAAEAVGLR